MNPNDHQLNIFFFPFLAHGHLIPTIDMAQLFASRGAKTTIVTTPVNANLYSNRIHRIKNLGFEIDILSIKFPALEVGLPEGFENPDSISDQVNREELRWKFYKATNLLQQPLENLLKEFHPSCLIADAMFPWATDAAAKLGIPRLVFQGTCFFSLCTEICMQLYEPHRNVSSDSEPFLVPNLPGEIMFMKKQLPYIIKRDDNMAQYFQFIRNSELNSFGVIVNSFYELEPVYSDFYSKVLGRRSWHIGPISLCNKTIEDKLNRGKQPSINEDECLKWLDSKKPNSVLYLCFGSIVNFSATQLKEIAKGLEASRQQFIWVVRKEKEEEWLPENFEKRMEGRGLIIRGWAPQLLILNHESTGGFVTHCGWNSILEGITAGKPMVTWPVFAEQFYNEKFVTQMLKIGISVGAQKLIWMVGDDSIKSEAIGKAVNQIMVGEEAVEMRSRVISIGDMARNAVEEGGSSYSDFNDLIEELKKSCH